MLSYYQKYDSVLWHCETARSAGQGEIFLCSSQRLNELDKISQAAAANDGAFESNEWSRHATAMKPTGGGFRRTSDQLQDITRDAIAFDKAIPIFALSCRKEHSTMLLDMCTCAMKSKDVVGLKLRQYEPKTKKSSSQRNKNARDIQKALVFMGMATLVHLGFVLPVRAFNVKIPALVNGCMFDKSKTSPRADCNWLAIASSILSESACLNTYELSLVCSTSASLAGLASVPSKKS